MDREREMKQTRKKHGAALETLRSPISQIPRIRCGTRPPMICCRYCDVLPAHPEERADVDDHCIDSAVLVEDEIADLTDVAILHVMDRAADHLAGPDFVGLNDVSRQCRVPPRRYVGFPCSAYACARSSSYRIGGLGRVHTHRVDLRLCEFPTWDPPSAALKPDVISAIGHSQFANTSYLLFGNVKLRDAVIETGKELNGILCRTKFNAWAFRMYTFGYRKICHVSYIVEYILAQNETT
jgi:hypothetical protein